MCSPKYQTLPFESCAYQSSVTSVGLPWSRTTSRTTLARTPSAISFVRRVTVITWRWVDPSARSVTLYTQRLPTVIGQRRLSMFALKSAGSTLTGSAP